MISYNLFFLLYCLVAILGFIYFIRRQKIQIVQESSFPIIVIVLIAILASVRPMEVKDTISYYTQYQCNYTIGKLLASGVFMTRQNGIEVVYIAFMSIMKMLNIPFRIFLFISAIVNCSTAYVGLQKISQYLTNDGERYSIGVITYFMACSALHYSCIAIRAGMSMGLGLLALGIFLTEKKKIASMLLFIFSVLIHTASILFIPIFCIYIFHLRIKRNFWGLTWIVAIMMLWINFGRYITKILLDIISNLFLKGRVFSGYLVLLEYKVGIMKWMLVIFIGIAFLIIYVEKKPYQETALVILAGLYIIALFYPVRAIARAYDYFLLFSVPYMAKSFDVYKKDGLIVLSHMVFFLLMLAIQLRICF